MFALRRRTRAEMEAQETARRLTGVIESADPPGRSAPDGAVIRPVEPSTPAIRAEGPAGPTAPFGATQPGPTTGWGHGRSPLGRLTLVEPGTGLPLGEAARERLEAAFGVDLSRVRVRPSDAAVGRRGARAETRGATIAFAPGAPTSNTRAGRTLLAHEVTHVLQQVGNRAAATASDKAAGAKLYYQQVVDEDRRTWGPHHAAVQPVLALFEAVERDDAAAVPTLVTALARVDGYVLPPDFPAGSVLDELLTRLVLLGLPRQSARVRDWYVKLPGIGFAGRRSTPRRYYDDEVWHWDEVVRRLRERVDWKNADTSLHVLDSMAAFFHQLAAERDGLDHEAVVQDRKRVAELYQSLGGLGVGFETSPNVTISRYHGALIGLMIDLYAGMQAAFQAVLELATAQLTANAGRHTILDALETRHTAVMARIAVPREGAPGGADFEVNRWEWRRRGRTETLKQVDAFPDDPTAARREVTVEPYDVLDTTSGPSRWLDVRRIFDIRSTQLAALKRIYGLETTGGQPTAEAAENRAAVAAAGLSGLRLHDDDDWRRFLRAKFDAHLKTSHDADESLAAVIDLLRVMLKAFTTHTPMNIEDSVTDLLRVRFPRDLTGRLAHDCGVYALRITYMLSLLREHPDLRLRFRWIQLPVHIGIVITGRAGISTWVVHNDQFTRGRPSLVAATRTTWDSLDREGKPRAPATPGTAPAKPTPSQDDQFIGELASVDFLEGSDMPFVLTDVPRLTGRDARVDKDELTRLYRSIVKVRLFGKATREPDDPAYQFHLKYLGVLDNVRAHHNTWLVPFWNVIGFTAWSRSRPSIEDAAGALNAASGPDALRSATTRFDAATTAYLDLPVGTRGVSVRTGLQTVITRYGPIRQLSRDITDAIRANPAILASGVARTSALRISLALGSDEPWWQRQVEEHIDALRRHTLQAPPYATQADQLSVVE